MPEGENEKKKKKAKSHRKTGGGGGRDDFQKIQEEALLSKRLSKEKEAKGSQVEKGIGIYLGPVGITGKGGAREGRM